jgi:hypothetical protein
MASSDFSIIYPLVESVRIFFLFLLNVKRRYNPESYCLCKLLKIQLFSIDSIS